MKPTSNNVNISEFRLTGLSRKKSFTLQLLHTDREIFWATPEMSQHSFDTFWNYYIPSNKYIAEVQHNGLTGDGIPIDPIVISIREIHL